MAIWNPWRGCHKIKEGCLNCYTHKGDIKREVDTNVIVRTDNFLSPIEKKSNGEYRIKSGSLVNLCFSSDFLIEEADVWRESCWEIIKERQDLNFLFLTKRIDRFMKCIPKDWQDGYDNVYVGCSVSTQEEVDKDIDLFCQLPIKHKIIICQPLIERVNIEKYLDFVDSVTVGGEYGENARPLDYSWVLSIREQCVKHNASFDFRQCGTYFLKDGVNYKLKYKELMSQAKKANINFTASK
jgi:protein gp37